MYSYQDKMIVDIITLDIALLVNPRWPSFGQGQTINLYNYRRKRSRLTILMSRVLMYARPSGVVRNYLRHYTVRKMDIICSRSSNKCISFLTEQTQTHDFGAYHEVFKYARPSDIVRNHFGHCMAN